MSARVAVLAAPAMPQVNLLPPEIRTARTFVVVRRWAALSVLLASMAAGAAYSLALLAEREATAGLERDTAETARLLAEQHTYADVTRLQGETDTVREARARGFATEVLWGDYLEAVVAVTPPTLSVTTLGYEGATPVVPFGSSVNPLVTSSTGTLAISAQADTLPDTAAWTDALDDVPGFRDAWVSTATRTGADGAVRYDVTATVQVDDRALAHRFDVTDGEGGA